MTQINFKTGDGQTLTYEGQIDQSVMKVAKGNEVPGILALCGGHAECGTCHVYVDDADLSKLQDAQEDELAMLEEVKAERKSNSRLSCQIKVTENLDGATFHIPQNQQ